MPPAIIGGAIAAVGAIAGSTTQAVVSSNIAAGQRKEAKRQQNVNQASQSKLLTEQEAEDRRADVRKRTQRMDKETQARIQRSQAGLIGQPLGGQTTLLGG